MATMMKLNTEMHRMDSLTLASNIKKMNRLELLYTCVANPARFDEKARRFGIASRTVSLYGR
ncbi:MAG: hypothetical protein MR308_04855 [Lachnospiraceae bacterium]|nr:hypothetical protein [Lachnospiraceae bacterium]